MLNHQIFILFWRKIAFIVVNSQFIKNFSLKVFEDSWQRRYRVGAAVAVNRAAEMLKQYELRVNKNAVPRFTLQYAAHMFN